MTDGSDTRAKASDADHYWLMEGFTDGGERVPLDERHMQGLDPSLKGIKIVDCDTHFSEPPDLFRNAPAKYKDRMPVMRTVDGFDKWFIGDRSFGLTGGNVIGNDRSKLYGRLAYPRLELGDPGSYRVKERLERMDEMGVHAHICFQNGGVTQAGSLMALGDDELALVIIQTFNDACAARQEESGNRLFSLPQLPMWDRAATMAEARRCIDLGLKGFVLPDKPERIGKPSWSNSYWDELWEMCEATGTPLNFHLNSSLNPQALTWDEFEFEQRLAVVGMMMSIANASNLGNWMVSGILDRYPKLKIGLIESGMGWIPFVVEMLEHQFDEMMPNFKKTLQKRPTEYFRDNFWCTFWYESIAPSKMLDLVGEDKVLFETDYPHPTSLYPDVQEHIVKVLGHHDYAIKKKILETNAVKLYNLPF
ncbi:amidohydrolase family protein [Novosphingobium bradum]|uniref:Amidohydrolase family protein n=1 Tax=Novosphingobium bradum TaxID=1737444 RepID=A0ABV7IRV9_9SPHN